jgi:hypothetical protein
MRCLLSLTAVVLCLARLLAADPVPATQVNTLRDLIKPGAKEDRWATIAWRISLWEARQEAAKAGKPILLWEMDGHPLGCT